MKRAAGPSREVCDLVDVRDQYRCLRCGVLVDGGSRHHRQLRRFGNHTAANLALMCGSGTTGCHGWAHGNPGEAYRTGWLVHSWHSPGEVPLWAFLISRMTNAWITLDIEGQHNTMTDKQAADRRIELGLS